MTQLKFFNAIKDGDLEEIKQFVGKLELRQVPFGACLNMESNIPEVRNLGPNFQWSAVLHLMCSKSVPEDHIIEVIRSLIA